MHSSINQWLRASLESRNHDTEIIASRQLAHWALVRREPPPPDAASFVTDAAQVIRDELLFVVVTMMIVFFICYLVA